MVWSLLPFHNSVADIQNAFARFGYLCQLYVVSATCVAPSNVKKITLNVQTLLWCSSGARVVLEWCSSGARVVLEWCSSGARVVLEWWWWLSGGGG